ncbi:MAG TPA: histidine kinase [Candidatus Polarisedimenticolaceae bacterium]
MAKRTPRRPARSSGGGKPAARSLADDPAELRRRAEARLRERNAHRTSDPDPNAQRIFHELEVHQIELEMQNAELFRVRNQLEDALARSIDLYDFAPVGYLTIAGTGAILEANLTGAALLGVVRSRLIRRRLDSFVAPENRSDFVAFLKRALEASDETTWEAQVRKEGGGGFWASFRATAAAGPDGTGTSCRLVFADITARREAADTQRRLDALAATNVGLKREIERRRKVEKALQASERQLGRLLEQSRHLQQQLRHLSHQILHAQEEERKRISRELHDEIAQTLVTINLQLANLARHVTADPRTLRRKIAETRRRVEASVEIVRRFARELRPTLLDDLGLIPALHAFMKELSKQYGLRTRLTAPASTEQLAISLRTVLYRVAHEALTNVTRHANASRVDVTIRKTAKLVSMTIADDGKSFPAKRVTHSPKGTHLGLLGMKERMEMVGGSLRIESLRGKGTTIHAEVPTGPTPDAAKDADRG